MKLLKYIFVLLVALIAGGCQNDLQYEEVVDNQEYLYLPEEIGLFSSLDEEQQMIVANAFCRIGIKETEDGLLFPKLKSAMAANVSDNVYNLVIGLIESYNNSLLGEIPFTRSNFISDGEGDGGPNDCMARAISGALGIGYDGVNAILTKQYGSMGVPYGKEIEAMQLFGEIRVLHQENLSAGEITGALIITPGHAMTVIKVLTPDYVLCKDFQNIGSNGEPRLSVIPYGGGTIYQYCKH